MSDERMSALGQKRTFALQNVVSARLCCAKFSGEPVAVFSTSSTPRATFKAVCELGLEGIVSKKLDAPIGRVPRKLGSKSKIRRHPLRPGPQMEPFSCRV